MLEGLNTVIKNTEPKLIPLVHLIEAFEAEMASQGDLSMEAAKKKAGVRHPDPETRTI